jgi:hypothetical protein
MNHNPNQPFRPQNFVPRFETWDLRRGERTSCSASEAEARSSCRNDRGRLLTIYAGDQIVASYRDGRDITADPPPCPSCGSNSHTEHVCTCPNPLDGHHDLKCAIHGAGSL